MDEKALGFKACLLQKKFSKDNILTPDEEQEIDLEVIKYEIKMMKKRKKHQRKKDKRLLSNTDTVDDASSDEEVKNKNDMIGPMPVAVNGLILYEDLFYALKLNMDEE